MTHAKYQRLVTKIISIITLIAILGANAGTPSVIAQENSKAVEAQGTVSSDTPTSPATEAPTEEPVSTETPPPPELTPSIMLTPTAEMIKSIDFPSAGEGEYFRALVSLHQPHDLARLKEWNIEVLEKFDGYAYVMVDRGQLEKLAHSGFDPGEVNSLDYMTIVYNALKRPSSLSVEELTTSPDTLMLMSGVDTDNDGLTDTEESWWCTDPNDNNSDSALAPSLGDPSDGNEVQAIINGSIAYGPPFALWPQFTPQDPGGNCLDGDRDSVPDNAEEFIIGTKISEESTDFDKFDDGQELFGRTYCLNLGGLCSYGDYPPAADGEYISSIMPPWVKAPGNNPFVAAFPEPEVEVVPSSLVLTQKTIITNTKGTTVGTEKTYGTSSTKGTSTSLAETETWNSWQEVSKTTALNSNLAIKFTSPQINNNFWKKAAAVGITTVALGGCLALTLGGCGVVLAAGSLALAANDQFYTEDVQPNITNITNVSVDQTAYNQTCTSLGGGQITCVNNGAGGTISSGQQLIDASQTNYSYQDRSPVNSGTGYSLSNQSGLTSQNRIRMTYPISTFTPTQTITQGAERGGAKTTTTSEYEEQTISESSTNQYSDNWSQSIATDPTHAADLRFTYHIVNNGTEYAREITSLIFNVYIGNDPNPAVTYCAIGSNPNCELPSKSNFFPGETMTFTAGSSVNTTIRLTANQMATIDEGTPVRVVMEDIAFGNIDQTIYQNILNKSVLISMEDGFYDSDETVDSYFIPYYPADTLQDVVKRYFPVTEDIDGNLLSVSTPEFNTTPPTFIQHSLTGSSWWNFYLSDGLTYSGAFADTLAVANSAVLVRILSDRDLDGYNDRNEIRLGTDPDNSASHPSPNLLAGYTKSCVGNDCTLRMTFQNLGNYDAYGVEAVLYAPDGNVTIANNTIGGSGRVPAGAKIVVGPTDTFQYTVTGPSPKEPVIVVSYNDPQGNHRFILPASALVTDLNNDLASLNGLMLPDPGVDISSTDATHANFVIFSSHTETITNGKLFVEYIDELGNVAHEDTFTQNFEPGPTVIPVTVDTVTYPPDQYILLAFFTDSQGNIIDSSARPLASFGADPLPEANLTAGNWKVGTRNALVTVPDPWNFGTVQVGTTLYADITLANSGMGELRYAMTGLGSGLTVTGSASGKLGPSELRSFQIALDTAGLTVGVFNRSLTIRTNDPNHATIAINLTGTIGTPPGTATAYKVNDLHPWDQYVYVPGPHNQNDVVTFTHTLADDPTRMFPLYLYDEAGTTLKGVGEYGVDFSGQTAPFGVFGTGADGDLIVTTGQTIYTDNTRSAVSATASSAQPNIALSSGTGFAAGQEVLIIQIQGTGAGVYEFANIASVSINTLALTKNLTNTYTVGGNSKAQVIRVMQYHDVTVQSGGVMTAHAWNGSIGGIVAFRSSGAVSIAGTINVNGYNGARGCPGENCRLPGGRGIGFWGGDGQTSAPTVQAWTGESSTGSSVQQQNPNGTGGGGGRNTGAPGGSPGGSGSYATAGSNGVGGLNGVNGLGATTILGDPTLSTLFFGGGGGGAAREHINDIASGGGGAGIIFVAARDLQVTGSISANGGNGGTDNAASGKNYGGAGAGGSVLIRAQNASLGTNRITALGGIVDTSQGGSGSGGVGRIRIEYGSLSGTTNPSASLQQVNYYNITGQGAPFGVFGNGSDGDLTVTTGQTIYTDNVRSAVASTASVGQANITLSNATGFAIGKEILIFQSQGTGAGAYEFAAIANVSGNILTLSKPLGNTYSFGGSSKAQALLVPHYQNVTVQTGGVLTAHAWDGSTGGIVAFRASGAVVISGTLTVTGKGFRGGSAISNSANTQGRQGEGTDGAGGTQSNLRNGNGGGGGGAWNPAVGVGSAGPGAGGGNGADGYGANDGGSAAYAYGGLAVGSGDLSTMNLGGGGGSGGTRFGTPDYSGAGASGGGTIYVSSVALTVTGTITANGINGNPPSRDGMGAGGGGSGGSIFLESQTATLGSSLITAYGGNYAVGGNGHSTPSGAGGVGRIRVEYGILSGTTNPPANTQQINYYNLTGSSSNTLYVPDAISAGSNLRYKLLYGQRSVNTTGGDQVFSVRLPNRQYSAFTLGALIEQVVGSGLTFNFCLDFGNDGTCDYTANSQAFSGPVRLDSSNLASALNTYITAQNSSAEILTIPIRVNINTSADIFLFNMAGTLGADADLVPSTLTLTPPSNIQEGALVTLNATVTNNGSHKAENFTVAFYYNNDTPGARDLLIGSTFIESLAPGASSPVQSVNWNTSGLLGLKTVSVKVDTSNKIAELNEANNILTVPATIRMKPDLVAVSMSIPDTSIGETVMVEAVIRNDGEGDANSALVRLYDDKPGVGNVIGSTTMNVSAGGSVNAQISYTPALAGFKKLYIKVDPDSTVSEANEGNNVTFSTGKTGWSLLTIDAGGAGDNTYSPSSGYGWNNGTVATTCGTEIEKSYRQAGSAETLTYRFDNLLPGRFYHLDLTFATCSGERWQDVLVDGHAVSEPNAPVEPVHVTTTPQTISLLIDPADYDDGTIMFSIRRASGLSGPLVNIIDLQEIDYCYRDSSPSEPGWSATNNCGFDATPLTDGFDGWGTLPEQTMRFGDSGVNYKFTALDPAKIYNVRLTFFEGDNTGRNQRILFDGVEAQTASLNSSIQHLVIAIPASAYADGQVIMSIQHIGIGEAIVNEVTLEEDSRAENNRYILNMNALTVSKAGTGVGTVTSNPTGINCGAACSAYFGNSIQVTLTATPATGSTFTGWSGSGCTGTGSCIVIMNAARSVTATFTLNTYVLTISKTGTGTGTVTSNPAGINCGATCATNLSYNTSVSLTATPNAGATFTGWSGSGCTGTGTCVVTMSAARSVTATFTLNTYTLTVSKAGTGAGSVTSNPTGINCGATCSANFSHNTLVTLTATPSTDSIFTGWSGSGCSGTGTCVVTMSAAKSIAANFILNEYTLTIISNNGTVTKSPDKPTYHEGDVVQLTATPNSGWSFTNWSGGLTSNNNPGSLTIHSNTTVNANYILGTNVLTVSKTGSGAGTVTSSPSGINCGATCSANFNGNTSVTLTADPSTGSTFTGWSGSCTGMGSCVVMMSATKSVTANFDLEEYILTITKIGNGTVSANPSTPAYHYGDVVNLSAIPAAGWSFEGWSANVVDGSVTVTGNTNVTATFSQTDTTSPTVLSSSIAGLNPTNTASVVFTVLFSESVNGVNIAAPFDDFTLTTSSGISGASIASVSGSGATYTITVNTGSGNGTIRLNVITAGGIADTANNPLVVSFTSGEIYTIIKSATFTDVPLTYWASNYIVRLYNAGITGGCSTNPLNYCPDSSVTRAQMAIFLLKGIHGSSYSPPAVNGDTTFTDVATNHWAAPWIKQLAAEGITSGCGSGIYCPEANVSRAQMAIFLLKAKHGTSYSPPVATGVFTDVPVGYWARNWIEQLATEGITSGCGTGVYCPEADVSRAQMAVFLVKTFNLP